MKRITLLLAALLWPLVAAVPAIAQEPQQLQWPPEVTKKVPLLSGMPSLIMAKTFGMTEIMGKDISQADNTGPPGNAKAKKLLDVPIGNDDTKAENEPTVAANPKDKKKMVGGSHWAPDPVTGSNRCVAYYSHDGGATWSDPFPMPHQPQNLNMFCSDPVLAYAPDGSRVYYSYMDITQIIDFGPTVITVTITQDIVVSYSDDDGATWSGPIVALAALPTVLFFDAFTFEFLGIDPGFQYDKNWVGTHVSIGGPQDNSDWVYVTATRFDDIAPGNCHIAFTRSDDKGLTWDTPVLLETGVGGCSTVVQGSRPSGGLGGDVLVAWYNSSDDGWLNGGMEIHTAYSSDYGATFNGVVAAATDNYEAPFWLGPFAFYKRWWGTMFPDVEIDAGGAAHLIYTHDPVENLSQSVSGTPEDGDVRYVHSYGPPYDTWSAPWTVNDDGMERAQGYAALETQHGGKATTVHVIWEDTRLTEQEDIIGSPDNRSPNEFWDIFYSRMTPGKGTGWFDNFRVTEASSLQDWIFTGDYNDLTANQTTLFSIFVDRRDKDLPNVFLGGGIYDFEDDVWGSEIIAGGGTGK